MNVMNYATRDVITVSPRDSIDKAITLMEEHGIHHLVVVGAGRVPVGMISDRDVLISTGWMLAAERRVGENVKQIVGPRWVEQVMSQPMIHAGRDDEMTDIAWAFHTSKIGALPIVNDRLLGIVTQTDLLAWLAVLGDNDSRVARILEKPLPTQMRAHVFTARPTDSLLRVVGLFKQHRIRHVPVTENEELVGIISDRDVRRAVGWSGIRDAQASDAGRIADTPNLVSEVMRNPVVTCSLSGTLKNALDLLLEHDIHSVVITEHRRVLGIITVTDFVRLVACEDLF